MRTHRHPASIACSLVLALIASATAASAATLGRGLEQLTALYETGNSQLASTLQLHIVAPDGAVMVHVRLDDTANSGQTLARLVANGLRITAMSEMDPTLVEGYVQLASARALASVAGVRHVLAVQRPRQLAGLVQSQAVAVQKADVAQARGVDGSGTRVGVLSDSYNASPFLPNAATDIATGDIPADIVVLQDKAPGTGTDEGRAMLQLVHDVAPGAKLGFATADLGEVQFSNNILALRRSFHADVIVDDVVYFDEPMFSDGLLAQTVDKVVSEGAAYFSSSGNNGLEAYQGNYDPISIARARQMVAEGKENIAIDELAANGLPAKSFHNFHNRDGSTSFTQRFTSYFGDVVDFQWDEPFDLGKVKTDYNIYVFDSAGHFIDPTTRDGCVLHRRRQHRDGPGDRTVCGEPGHLSNRDRQGERRSGAAAQVRHASTAPARARFRMRRRCGAIPRRATASRWARCSTASPTSPRTSARLDR